MTELLADVGPERVIDLRHRLLRPHQERTAAGASYEAVDLCGHGKVFDLPPLEPHCIYGWRPPASP